MKNVLVVLAGGALAASLVFGQGAAQPPAAAQGQGRGSAPFAWGDRNRDGICDFTGRPVGQGRAARAAGRGAGWIGQRAMRGPGRRGCRGIGMARGWRGQPPAPQAAPEAKK
jgi:hypothetical protein